MQALLRDLPVHARPAAGMAGRLPAADAALADRPEQGRRRLAFGAAARPHRPTGQGRDGVRAARERDREVAARAHRDGEGHRHRARPPAADLRPRAVLEVVPRPQRARPAPAPAGVDRGPVALFPTCLVEYQEPAIGKALVAVFEHNGFTCELPDGQVCCGMPWLDAGDAESSATRRSATSTRCSRRSRPGRSIVVPQPTCAYTLKDEYPAFLGTDAARKVAAATFDAAEFLMDAHKEREARHRLRRPHVRDDRVARRVSLPAQQIGPRSSQLMQLTGAKVQMVERCSAIDGTWGLRAENVELARRVAKPLMEKVRDSDAELVAGDCQLANVAIDEGSGKRPIHPLQVLARAYGSEERAMRKLTVDDIVDMRAYERERDDLRRRIIDLKKRAAHRARSDHDDRVREHRDHALAGAGDGAGRADAARRADRARDRDVQPAHPRRRDELSATLMIELTSEPALREWLPRLVGIEHHIAVVLPDGTRVLGAPSEEDEIAPHPRRHHRRGPLPEVPLRPRPTSRCSRAARCTSWSTIPSTTRTCCSRPNSTPSCSPTCSDARRRTRRSPARDPAVLASLPASAQHPRPPSRSRRPAAGASRTRATRATTSPRASGARLEPGGGRALVPTGHRDRDPRGLRRVRPAAVGPRAAARCHVSEHARADRRRLPRRDQRAAREPRSRTSRSRCAAAIASRSSSIQRVQDVEWEEVDELDDSARGTGGWGSTGRR